MLLSPQSLIGRGWSRGVAVAAAAGALAACSLLVPLNDQQCTANADCAARGFAGAACVDHVCVASGASDAGASDAGLGDADPWACLDQPPEVTSANTQVVVTLKLFDPLTTIETAGPQGGSDFTALSYVAVPGIAVEGCGTLDPLCAKPLTPVEISDDAGDVSFTTPGNFNGFFEFTGAGYLPSKLYPGQLLADASTFAPPVAILGTQEVTLLASAIGVPMELDPDAGVGHVFFQVYDCFDRHAAGVAFTLAVDAGPTMVEWYLENELPSTTATETDSVGSAGAVNVPAGALTVKATLVTTKRTIGTINTVITPGATTFAFVRVRTH